MTLTHVDSLIELVAVLMVALLGGGILGVSKLLALSAEIKKLKADAEAVRQTAEAAATHAEMEVNHQLIVDLQADNNRLRETLRQVENYWKKQVDDLQREVARLRQIMRECGIDPDGPTSVKKDHTPDQSA